MKAKANLWLMNNLFWIVPLYFLILAGGIASSVYRSLQIKSDTETSLVNQQKMLKNQDTIKINNNINSLKEALRKYKK